MTATDPSHAAPGAALAAAYEETYAAVLGLLGDLDDRQLATVIPACPAWTVRELVAHLAGGAEYAVSARFPAVDVHGPWAARQAIVDAATAAQVNARRGLSLDQVLTEWAGYVRVLGRMLRGEQPFPPGSLPAVPWMVVGDLAAHAQDLRGTFHRPGDRDSAGVSLGLEHYVSRLGHRITAADLPALRLRTEQRAYVAGLDHGAPDATVTASPWELFRALSGRRSRSQLRALRWSGDPELYLPLLPAYGERADDLIE